MGLKARTAKDAKDRKGPATPSCRSQVVKRKSQVANRKSYLTTQLTTAVEPFC